MENEGSRNASEIPEGSKLTAAANRRAIETYKTSTAAVGAGSQGIAAGLDQLTAGVVAAGAGDAAAIFGEFTLAHSASQLDVADGHAVELTANGTEPTRQHSAEILHHATGHFIRTTAVNFHAVGTLLEANVAPRNHAPIRRLRGRCLGCQ